jgi:hypothetical protein
MLIEAAFLVSKNASNPVSRVNCLHSKKFEIARDCLGLMLIAVANPPHNGESEDRAGFIQSLSRVDPNRVWPGKTRIDAGGTASGLSGRCENRMTGVINLALFVVCCLMFFGYCCIVLKIQTRCSINKANLNLF